MERYAWPSLGASRVHGYADLIEPRRQTRFHMSNLMLEIEALDRNRRGALASEVM